MPCMRIKGVVISHDYAPSQITLVRLVCKQWSCPSCGPQNAVNWRAYLLKTFNDKYRDEQWCFFTITAERSLKTAIGQITNLQNVWKRLYDRLRRRYGKKNTLYVRMFEPGELKGRFHMHFLMNCGQAYDSHNFVISDLLSEMRHPECKWLRKACAALRGGWRVHIRRVWEAETKTTNVGLVVGYLIKYIGKNMASFEFPKYQRRIQCSREIGSPPRSKVSSGTWEMTREISRSWLSLTERPMLDLTAGQRVTLESFEGEFYYPPLRFYGARGEDEEGEP